MSTWLRGRPSRLSLFWSGRALYLNVSLLKFTVWWRPALHVGAFRHVRKYAVEP